MVVERLENLLAELPRLEHGLAGKRWLALGRDVLALLEFSKGCQGDEQWQQVDRQLTGLLTRHRIQLTTAAGPVSFRGVTGASRGDGRSGGGGRRVAGAGSRR